MMQWRPGGVGRGGWALGFTLACVSVASGQDGEPRYLLNGVTVGEFTDDEGQRHEFGLGPSQDVLGTFGRYGSFVRCEPGETLDLAALRSGLDPAVLRGLNRMGPDASIAAGDIVCTSFKHRVLDDESLADIATAHATTVKILRELNGLGADQSPEVWSEILVPVQLTKNVDQNTVQWTLQSVVVNPTLAQRLSTVLQRTADAEPRKYTVVEGDTWQSVAEQFGTTAEALQFAQNFGQFDLNVQFGGFAPVPLAPEFMAIEWEMAEEEDAVADPEWAGVVGAQGLPDGVVEAVEGLLEGAEGGVVVDPPAEDVEVVEEPPKQGGVKPPDPAVVVAGRRAPAVRIGVLQGRGQEKEAEVEAVEEAAMEEEAVEEEGGDAVVAVVDRAAAILVDDLAPRIVAPQPGFAGVAVNVFQLDAAPERRSPPLDVGTELLVANLMSVTPGTSLRSVVLALAQRGASLETVLQMNELQEVTQLGGSAQLWVPLADPRHHEVFGNALFGFDPGVQMLIHDAGVEIVAPEVVLPNGVFEREDVEVVEEKGNGGDGNRR